jgi:ribosomal protein L16 Arg81 hydroxylase/GNAT superfamily N-acetyltransferase
MQHKKTFMLFNNHLYKNHSGASNSFISQLLGEDGVNDFKEHVWQQKAKIISGEASARLGDLWISEADINEIFYSIDFPLTNFDMADGVQPLPKNEFAPAGVVNRNRVTQLHKDGATIILRAAHRWCSKLRLLCSALEWDFGCPVQANIYLTPAGKKSTPPHWDTHDLFILQIKGKKNWRMFSNDYSFPLDFQRYNEKLFPNGALTHEISIHAGEVMYLPRGAVHEPVADNYSIHISFGVLVSRWAEALSELVNVAAQHEEVLRRIIDLPCGRLGPTAEEAFADKLFQLVDLLKDRSLCRKAVSGHLRHLVSQHGETVKNRSTSIFETNGLAGSSTIRRVRAVYLAMELHDEKIEVIWKGGSISLPRKYQAFIDTILNGNPFVINSETTADVEEECIALCETLVHLGLLEILPPVINQGMSEKFVLRRAQESDADYVMRAELETAEISFQRKPEQKEIDYRNERLHEALANGNLFIGELADDPIGYWWIEERPKGIFSLIDFYVSKGYRGHGISDWLLSKALSVAKTQSVQSGLKLVISDKNLPAVRFFKNHGALCTDETPSAEGLREYWLPIN